MAVRIRLKRMGRKNYPMYRVCAFDARSPRDGKSIEILGSYNPHEPDDQKKVVLKKERIEYWLSVGAKPSETVRSFIKKAGIEIPVKKKKKRKKKGKQKETV